MSGNNHTVLPKNIFEWRIRIWNDTRELSFDFPFKPSEKIVYDPAFIMEKRYATTHIHVYNKDTIVAGHDLQEKGYNPLLLNFADDHYAGGAVETGSGAQEEALFRRTNYCATLEQDKFYPILHNEAVYSPRVSVFRDTEENKYRLLRTSFKVSFIAVPGLYLPRVTKEKRLSKEDETILKNKIRLILQVAYKRGHDSLVLGALGCGAWRNPPRHVAEIFKSVLDEYIGAFQEVVFACFDTTPEPNNYTIFQEVLG